MTTSNKSSFSYGMLLKNREIHKLADLCMPKEGIQTGPFGSQLHSSDYVAEGIPIITVEHLGENRIEGKQPPLVSKEDVKRLAKYTMQEGDILFSRVGSVDRRALVTKEQNGWMFSGRLVRIRPDRTKIDPKYLSYFFGLPSFKNHIRSIAVGATMPSLNTELLSNIGIITCNIEEQRAIGRILENLDAKININNQMANSLESIARTLFKSWFIDFDAVRMNMDADTALNLDAETLSLFPSAFQDSELGAIPSGWMVSSADELFDVGIGRTPPRKEQDWFCSGGDGIPWVSIRDMGTFSTFSGITNEGLTTEAVSKFRVPIVPANTVLMSFKLTVGKLCITDRELVTNEAIAHFRIKETTHLNSLYTYLWLSQHDMSSLDSTSSIGIATNTGVIRKIKFLVPELEVLEAFNKHVAPIFNQIQLIRKQVTGLSELRDSLLQRLISGELQVPSELIAS